jgi:hypothetical protein
MRPRGQSASDAQPVGTPHSAPGGTQTDSSPTCRHRYPAPSASQVLWSMHPRRQCARPAAPTGRQRSVRRSQPPVGSSHRAHGGIRGRHAPTHRSQNASTGHCRSPAHGLPSTGSHTPRHVHALPAAQGVEASQGGNARQTPTSAAHRAVGPHSASVVQAGRQAAAARSHRFPGEQPSSSTHPIAGGTRLPPAPPPPGPPPAPPPVGTRASRAAPEPPSPPEQPSANTSEARKTVTARRIN